MARASSHRSSMSDLEIGPARAALHRDDAHVAHEVRDTPSTPVYSEQQSPSMMEKDYEYPAARPVDWISSMDSLQGRQNEPEPGQNRDDFPGAAIQAHIPELGIATQNITAQQTHFAALREQALIVRDQVSYHREEHNRIRAFVMDTMKKAVDSFADLTSEVSLPQFFSHYRWHWEKLEMDHKRLLNHEAKLHTLEFRLSNLEYQMQQEEKQLAYQAEEATNVIEKMQMSTEDERMIADRDPVEYHLRLSGLTGPTEVEAPEPLLAEYYDKIGEVKIMHDRKVEFDSDYASRRAALVFEVDHERAYQSEVDEYDATAKRDRSQYMRAIEQAITRADVARDACIQAGLNPDGYKSKMQDEFEEAPYVSEDDIVRVIDMLPGSHNQNSEEHHLESQPPTNYLDRPPVALLASNSPPGSPTGHTSRELDERTREWIESNAIFEHHPGAPRLEKRSSWPGTETKRERDRLPKQNLSNLLHTASEKSNERTLMERRPSSESQLNNLLQAHPELARILREDITSYNAEP